MLFGYEECMTRLRSAELLKGARDALDLDQIDIAKKLDVTQACVSKWEAGHQVPRAADLGRVAKAYKVPLDSLYAAVAAQAEVNAAKRASQPAVVPAPKPKKRAA
jgi:transcriptional regulator with XRE-family HTH domain